MNMGPYDRIDVVVAGLEELTARPTKFETDDDGNPTLAIEFETTCPSCGEVINFIVEEIMQHGGKSHVNCPNCQTNYIDEYKDKKPDISVRMGGQKIDKEKPRQEKKGPVCPFIDPIEEGMFEPNNVFVKAD
jgi:hypothetical protein